MTWVEVLPARMLFVVGLIFCLAALALAFLFAQAALMGWLAAFVFVSALPLGALCLTMMMTIIPGVWREALAGETESALLLLPLVLLASLPVLAGIPWIYGWAGAAHAAAFKGIFLTPGFFALRTLLILAAACVLAGILIVRRDSRMSAALIGIIAFVPLHGLLATDWLVSLDTQFHSSGFGLYFLAGQMLNALATLIVMRAAAGATKQLLAVLGALFLTAILLWVYLAFMQYFIVWSGNLPQGVAWFQRRGAGLWAGIEHLIAILRLLPLFLLVFPPVRRSGRWLVCLSICVLAGGLLENIWLTLPALQTHLGLAVTACLTAVIGLTLLGLAILSRSAAMLARLRPTPSIEVRS
ncbi:MULTISPECIES: hypothetical protein [unclassified Sinorhizobium]|uniref:hypothetical protein n=1 Tax=unclassified Sinorhizobium TaxID=2613772 RepID=UPI0035231C8F